MHVLGTPPALILSQDQTLHKNSWSFEQALFSLTGRTNPIARARRSIRIASPDLAVAFRRRRRHKLYGTRAWCGTSRWSRGNRSTNPTHLANPKTNKNADLSDRALPALGRRPTDLCATALFSFQGTDASARPISDRITDRTKGARRQSQRSIDYHRAEAKSTSKRAVRSPEFSTSRADGRRAR